MTKKYRFRNTANCSKRTYQEIIVQVKFFLLQIQMYRRRTTYNWHEAKDGILLIAYYVLGILLLVVKLLVVSNENGTRLILLLLATAATACAIYRQRKKGNESNVQQCES